jgi:hypothetical protein
MPPFAPLYPSVQAPPGELDPAVGATDVFDCPKNAMGRSLLVVTGVADALVTVSGAVPVAKLVPPEESIGADVFSPANSYMLTWL